jgi:hypothetical protein
MGESNFCPHCGVPTDETDRFCRNCGFALVDTRGAVADEPSPGRRRRRGLLVGSLVFLVLLAALALAVGLSGVLDDSDEEAAREAARASAQQKRALDAEMRLRDRFFTTERAYRAAMASANGKARNYRKTFEETEAETERIEAEFEDEFDECARDIDVECPDPTYPEFPEAPDVSADTKKLRAAAADFEELRATALTVSPRPELRALHTQLLEATQLLGDDANHNADVFDEAISEVPTEGEGGGDVNQGKLKTLRQRSGLPAIREMNRAAVDAIKRLKLPLGEYDVPGGRDLDPSDHSTAV